MGTKCAPSYVIIFMGKLESHFLATRQLVPLVWWRYIDDIFMICPHSIEELYSFLTGLNEVHPSIKFTSNFSQTHVSFLDVLITKDINGNLETGLYTKPTDAHLYLHYDPFHPLQQKKSIPFSQAIRLRRICSTPDRYREATDMLYQNLTVRGYPKRMVRNALDQAFLMNRTTLLQLRTPSSDKRTNRIPFIITYNPSVDKVLKTNKHILSSSGELKQLKDSKFLVESKRAMNIKQLLVRTNINQILIQKGSGPCNTPCKTCPFMQQTTSIVCWTTKQSIPIQGRYNC